MWFFFSRQSGGEIKREIKPNTNQTHHRPVYSQFGNRVNLKRGNKHGKH